MCVRVCDGGGTRKERGGRRTRRVYARVAVCDSTRTCSGGKDV